MAIARISEIASMSRLSFEDAISQGMLIATNNIAKIHGAWVTDQKAVLTDCGIREFHVTLQIVSSLD